MRRGARISLAVAALAAVAVVAGGKALAYFTGAASGTASAAVTSLSAPTISAATPAAGGTVSLTWGAVTAPGSGTVKYYVTRDGGEPAGTCATEAAPTTATSCKDAEVPVGEHSYRVVAKWRAWTATSAAKAATVTIGEAVKFTISGSTTTPATGAAVNLTITAKDSASNTVTSYTGSHSVVFSGASAGPEGDAPTVVNSSGTAIEFGKATALTFSSGVASVSSSKNGVLHIYDAGPARVTATSETLTTPAPLELTVNPTATQFTLEAATPTPALGAGDNTTITAFDNYGNVSTTYEGSKSLAFSGASAIGGNTPTVTNSSGTAIAFGTATTITFTAGVAESAGGDGGKIVLYKAGATEIKATQSSVTTPTPLVLTPPLGAPSKFVLTGATTPAVGATDELTITATDTFGNTTPSYSGSKSLVFSGANASPSGETPTVTNSSGTAVAFGSATTVAFTAGVAESSKGTGGKAVFYKAESVSLQATQGSLTTPTALAVTPTPGTASKLVLSSSTTTPTAGTAFNLTTTAQDTYGNTATAYTGSKNITFSGAGASPNATTPTVANSSGTATNFGTATALTFSSGVATVSGTKNGSTKLYLAGATSVTASDGTISTPSAIILTVSTATASKVAVNGLTASAGVIGSPCVLTCAVTLLGNSGTIKAKVAVADTYGNIMSNLGSTKSATVTVTTGGTITGSPLTIPSTGSAISSAEFTYKSPSSGSFTHTITIAVSGYTSATVTASK